MSIGVFVPNLFFEAPRLPLRALSIVERLESRQLLSVSLDAGGWTVVSPSGADRVIYVSSSTGNNANSGLSSSAPVATLARAESLLRNNSGDEMLLKRGDSWSESLGVWRLSGRSPGDPMVIGAYGTGARPVLNTGAASALILGISSAPEVNYLDVIGLNFYANTRDPASPQFSSTAGCIGVYVVSKTDGLLIEDCRIADYGTDISIDPYFGHAQNVQIRRSIVVDSYSADGSHSEGLYANGVGGLLLEGNSFDHDGWNTSVAGAEATIFNHDAYLSNTVTGVIVRDNLFAEASSHGLQARSGGDVEGNVFLDDPVGMSFGLVNGSPVTAGGVSGIVNGNVFMGSRTINGAVRGYGIEIGNTSPTAQTIVSNNIFTSNSSGDFPAIMLVYGKGVTNPSQAVGLNNLVIEGNIINKWTAGLSVEAGVQPGGTGALALNHVAIRDNAFSSIVGPQIVEQLGAMDPSQEIWTNNVYSSTGGAAGESLVELQGRSVSLKKASDKAQPAAVVGLDYVDPARSAATYSTSIGAASNAVAFISGARMESSQNSNPQYVASALVGYEQAGFESADAPPRNWNAPTPPTASATVPAIVSTNTEATTLTFSVTYTDVGTVDLSSIASANVVLTGPAGSALPAMLTTTSGSGGGPVVATYTIAAPAGTWRRANRGIYHLMLQPQQIRDTNGFYTPAESLAKFNLRVARTPLPPQVRHVKYHAHHAQSLSIQFSSDVGSSISAAALALVDAAGNVISPSLMTMTYVAATRTAIWKFPGFANGILPAGNYHFTLIAATITDASGRHLDGNRDGIGGDDFVWNKTFRSKG